MKKRVDRYTIQSACTEADFHQIRELRELVFCRELGGAASLIWQARDEASEHLMVIDRTNNQLQGVIRISPNDRITDFESKELSGWEQIAQFEGLQVELGQACVRPESRNGRVIRLLMSGVLEFCKARKVRLIFGTASMMSQNEQDALRVYDLMKNPRIQKSQRDGLRIPPLLHFYLKAGAIVLSPPLFDPEYKCFDFLTYLDIQTLTESVQKSLEILS